MATVRLRNINPLGQVDLPLINRQGAEHLGVEGIGNLEPGEVFEVDAKLAPGLLAQASNYEPADDAAVALDAQIEANAFRHRTKPPAKRARRTPAKPKSAAPAELAKTNPEGAES